MSRLLALLVVIGACVDPPAPLPTCAELGCAVEPSADPLTWAPCEPGAVCYCGTDSGEDAACEFTPPQPLNPSPQKARP